MDVKILEEKIKVFSEAAELMPCVVIIHDILDFSVVFMSSNGLEQLGIGLKEIRELGPAYHEKFFNNEDMQDFVNKLHKLLEKGDSKEVFSFFQQVKLKDREEWVWHFSATRIFHQDENGRPTHMISVAIPIDQMRHIPKKAERLLEENIFYNTNLEKFEALGERGKAVLRLVAMGKSSSKIAEELHISVETVSTHRKIIKQKLGISSTYEFTVYAHAFDLI